MRLVKFRIQNYKRIEATDWIEVDDVTALVGGNETGKTSVLQALWKLKPGRENIVLDAQEEYPRRRYTTDYLRGDLWPVVSAVFDVDPELRAKLIEIDPAFKKCRQVECTSYYDHDPMVAFVPGVELVALTAGDVQKLAQRVTKAVQKGQPAEDKEALKGFQEAVADIADRTLEQLKAETGGPTPKDLLSSLYNQLNTISRDEWQKALWADVAGDIEGVLNRQDTDERFQEAINLAWEAVPVFIYFDDYNLLESEVYIPDAIQRMAAGSTDPKVRSQWALFERAGFPIREISGLSFRPDPGQPVTDDSLEGLFEEIKERAIIASSAGRVITEEFANWWHQHRHEIDFRVDGETFQIWVADDKYPVLIEFEGRSRGFRWFFTFYLVFTVETGHAHKNAVLLLDEPGLHLYPPAQEELLQLFDELSHHNQVIYTTHSPFMIDSRHLERVRVVEEMDDGLVTISDNVGHSGSEAIFPIQARLAYQLAQSLFVARRVLIVKGEADYQLLLFLSQCLEDAGRAGLPDGMAITFAGGNSSIEPMVAMMVPQGFEVVVLLDDDPSGRATGKMLEQAGFASLPSVEWRTYGDILGRSAPFDLESLLPPDLYLRAVEESHGVQVPASVKPTKKQTLSAAVEAHFGKEGLRLDQKKTMQWLLDLWTEGAPVPDAVLEGAEALFRAVQEALEGMQGAA